MMNARLYRTIFVSNRLILALAVQAGLCGVATIASPAHVVAAAEVAQPGADSTSRRHYDIAPAPLGDALAQFAAMAGIALSFDPAPLAGLRSDGLHGSYSVSAGFAKLLAGSGYELVDKGGGAWSLRKAPTGEALLKPVQVTAAGERTAYDRVQGFVARRSATATKTDTPLIETPQSISVVGADEIETIKAQSLMDALGYVAGVARVEGLDRTTESLLLRGFEAWADNGSMYRDGIKYGVNLNNGTQEPYGLERVELLKGAASVLYGAAAPGGIINTVSKRPTTETLRELNAELGSFERRQLSGDFAGALDGDANWSYRLTLLKRDSDSFVDHVPDNRTYIAPAFKWQPSAATSLTFLSEYQHDRTAYVYALPAEGTVLPNRNGRISRDRFQGEPGFDEYDNTRWSAGYLFEHSFDEQLRLHHSLRYFHQANRRPFIYSTVLTGDQRSVERGAVDVRDRSTAITTDTSLEYKWSQGAIAHTTLFGLDHTTQKHQQAMSTGDVAPLDIFAPVYGAAVGPMTAAGTKKLRDEKTGLYLQDQLKIDDRWVVLLSGRQDWSGNDNKPAAADSWSDERSDAFTVRAGVVYLADNGIAPFVSYSQSFEPVAGTDRSGGRFEPSEGEQYEVGLRYQPVGSETSLSAALYQLTKTHVSVTDPLDVLYSVQLGEARSRGLELEARTRLWDHFNLAAAYAYTDARTLKSSPLTPENDGSRTGGVPYHQASLWIDYDFAGIGWSGFKAGIGGRYVGATTGSYIVATVPAFTLVDAMVSYLAGPWQFALNATNLTDRNYVASCTYGCFYGEPRKVIGTVSYRW